MDSSKIKHHHIYFYSEVFNDVMDRPFQFVVCPECGKEYIQQPTIDAVPCLCICYEAGLNPMCKIHSPFAGKRV